MTDTCSVFAEHMELDPTSAGSLTAADTADGAGGGVAVDVVVGVDVGAEEDVDVEELELDEEVLGDELWLLADDEPELKEGLECPLADELEELLEDELEDVLPVDEDEIEALALDETASELDVLTPPEALGTPPELCLDVPVGHSGDGVEAATGPGWPVGAMFATTTVVVVAIAASPAAAAPIFTLAADRPTREASRDPDRGPGRPASIPARPASIPFGGAAAPAAPPAAPPPPPNASSGKAAIIAATAAARSRVPRSFQSAPYPATATRSRCARKLGTSWYRWSGSFDSPRTSSGRTGSGTSSSGTGAVSCASRSPAVERGRPRVDIVSAENGRCPASVSKKTTDAAYMSVAGVARMPFHCSGAI